MTECVVWKGTMTRKGYGQVWLGNRRYRAHRVFFILYNGKIPRGYDVHHTCENKLCVNPAHLVALTKAEHARLHPYVTRARPVAQCCKYGHSFAPENTERQGITGKRRCIICRRRRDKMRNARFRKVPA